MKSFRYIRECTPSDDCGTCGGNCDRNDDCHGVNVCSKDFRNPRDIYDIPGCKGDPAKVKDRNGKAPPSYLDPLEDIGYCYKPPSSRNTKTEPSLSTAALLRRQRMDTDVAAGFLDSRRSVDRPSTITAILGSISQLLNQGLPVQAQIPAARPSLKL